MNVGTRDVQGPAVDEKSKARRACSPAHDVATPVASDVAVVISTRNRPEGVVGTVESILRNYAPPPQTIIVDQSDNDLTCDALKRFAGQYQVHYVRATSRGLAAGRNEGIRNSSAALIAMTDDDCHVTPGWLESLMDGFKVDERIGIVFGNVGALSHDRERGFVPAYERTVPYLARSIFDAHHVEGIGANFCVRRSTWEALNGFDECFGAGARFGSAEDVDLKLRALAKGHGVYETPRSVVIHHGFRTWEEGNTLIWGYLYGIGAAMAKQLRISNWKVLPLLAHLAYRWAFSGPVVDLGDRKPPRFLRIHAFLKGFWEGLMFPLNRDKGHFDLSPMKG